MAINVPFFDKRQAFTAPFFELSQGDIIAFEQADSLSPATLARPYLGTIYGVGADYARNAEGAYEAVQGSLKLYVLKMIPHPFRDIVPNDTEHLMIADIDTKKQMGLHIGNNYRLRYELISIPLRLDSRFRKTGTMPHNLSNTILRHAIIKLGVGQKEVPELATAAENQTLEAAIGRPLFSPQQQSILRARVRTEHDILLAPIPEQALMPGRILNEKEKLYKEVVIDTAGQLQLADPASLDRLITLYKERYGPKKWETQHPSHAKVKDYILNDQATYKYVSAWLKASDTLNDGNSPDHIESLSAHQRLRFPDTWKHVEETLGIQNISDIFYETEQEKFIYLRQTLLRQDFERRFDFLRLALHFGVTHMASSDGEDHPDKNILNVIVRKSEAESFKETHPKLYESLKNIYDSSGDFEHFLESAGHLRAQGFHQNYAKAILSVKYLEDFAKGLVSEPQITLSAATPDVGADFRKSSYDFLLTDLFHANVFESPGTRLGFFGLRGSASAEKPESDPISFKKPTSSQQVKINSLREAWTYMSSLTSLEPESEEGKIAIIQELQKIEGIGAKSAAETYGLIRELYRAATDVQNTGDIKHPALGELIAQGKERHVTPSAP
ncbi:MAG: hypothetical protein J0L77_07895 [Alphaproteobacteria bacterium]|nr:hypothetical protein [Alphaproteobacteria bacterium]